MCNVYDMNVYPKRVFRFVPSLPGSYVAQLDPATNVLLIDRGKFDTLDKWQRESVYVTKADMIMEEAQSQDMWA